jgi:hypothetical protein
MLRSVKVLLCAALAFAAITAACGGSDDDDGKVDGDGGNTPAASETAQATEPAAGETPDDGGSAEIVSTPPAASDRVWTAEEAQTLLDTLPLVPADLPSEWILNTDTVQDNAAATTAGDMGAASFERCGRLLSRLVVNMAPMDQTVARYIGGETVSFFSTFTVYATDAGAADCAAENAARLATCPEIAKAFGSVFIDPAAVSCVPFDFPQLGNGSLGIGLTGKISAAGTIVDLTIRIVAWRYGNITAVIGNAAAFDPSVDELIPLAQTVLDRLEATRE